VNKTIGHQDTPWKEIIDTLFPRFVQFFFPDAYTDIDWSRKPVFLDKELQQVMLGAVTGRRYVDKLVKVWRLGGEEAWVLIHIEVQGRRESGFPRRMFVYHNRLFDRYGCLVASLVVLTDDSPNWRPDEYKHGLWGTEAALKFRAVKLLDYREGWEELAESKNPFAVVVMAHLKAHATRRDEKERLRWKLILAKMLYGKGYRRDEVLGLFRFMDYVLALPDDLKRQYEGEMTKYEETQKVAYLSGFERKGLEQGLKQGLEQGQLSSTRAAILEVLKTRFEKVPDKVSTRLNKIADAERLRELLRKAVLAPTVKEFQREITP
jgi:flagellar biosynthesis/type III secretory pathway protein FliH